MPDNTPKLCNLLVCAPTKITANVGETKHSKEGKRRWKRQNKLTERVCTLDCPGRGRSTTRIWKGLVTGKEGPGAAGHRYAKDEVGTGGCGRRG